MFRVVGSYRCFLYVMYIYIYILDLQLWPCFVFLRWQYIISDQTKFFTWAWQTDGQIGYRLIMGNRARISFHYKFTSAFDRFLFCYKFTTAFDRFSFCYKFNSACVMSDYDTEVMDQLLFYVSVPLTNIGDIWNTGRF